jgi:hypothetical protein
VAYDQTKYEIMVGTDVDLNSAADCGDWAPGYIPHIVRAVAVVVTNTLGGAGVLKVDKRPTAGDDTGRGDGDIATVTLPNGTTAGSVIYVDGLNVRVDPGQEAVAEVTDVTAASDTAHVILYVEPTWERPANNTAMAASA